MIGTAVVSALVLGLVGSSHCAAMCGGIAALATPKRRLPTVDGPSLLSIIAQNAGRITSYVLAGAIAGAVGDLASARFADGRMAIRIALGLLLMGVGLVLAGLFPARMSVETAMRPLWRLVEPVARRLLPIRSAPHAFAFGLIWGWLPCGLVYSALSLAAVSGTATSGALTLGAFGLGTLPMMTAVGFLATKLTSFWQRGWARRAIGLGLAIFGAVHLALATQSLAQPQGEATCCHRHP